MYERKIPVDLSCPLRLTMSLIDSKWKSCILDELRDAPMRPSELHKALPEAAPRVLDLQLKELVDDGLVTKTIYPELPPRSEYSITELGRSLLPILDAMIAWGETNKAAYVKEEEGVKTYKVTMADAEGKTSDVLFNEKGEVLPAEEQK
ncbi:MAG: helix-turn-helix transcriptional regulator [Rikenellaceae bacterium]|nr:helix-turn-helix transcriptional regulator [Rikenellaceae bacterium]